MKKDKLIIIGNGFDVWQGLPTRYENFAEYYYANRDDILKKLLISKRKFVCDDGTVERVSDAELIYTDALEPAEFAPEFWNEFENSLQNVDAERINLYFGKSNSDLRQLRRSVINAKKVLTKAFRDWVNSIEIPDKPTPYVFDEDCTFLNFNYTATLEKIFNVPRRNVYHIHGEARKRKSIIFGHSSHPEPPLPLMKKIGGRFEGLYYVDTLLYETDKKVQDNILAYIGYLAHNLIMAEDIKYVYVLGHSFGMADFDYFKFLVKSTKKTAEWHISCFTDSDKIRVQKTMKKLRFKNFTIYNQIDDCVKKFSKEE